MKTKTTAKQSTRCTWCKSGRITGLGYCTCIERTGLCAWCRGGQKEKGIYCSCVAENWTPADAKKWIEVS